MRRVLHYFITFLMIILFWWFLAAVFANPLLPSPLVVLQVLKKTGPSLWNHLLASSFRIAAGLGVSLFFGVPLGLILGRSNKIDNFLAPVIYFIYPIPKIAFLPMVLLLLGLGDLAKIFMIALIVFFQILVTTRDAARDVDQELIFSVKSLGANRWQLFWRVVFPASLPQIFTAVRISLGTAIAVLFFTETFATFRGLGFFIMDAWSRVNYQEMFAGILALSILGLVLFLLVDLLERLICPWLYLDN